MKYKNNDFGPRTTTNVAVLPESIAAPFGLYSLIIPNQIFSETLELLTRYFQIDWFFKRSALLMTETELKLIAAAAIMGDSNQPVSG
ncbi:Uncharacterised protein [BD1-7 clade bacterium]|uniref:Uncharacterized protein n=1 Tax=BD1-7 clade bacterium TaxID=2029982 RepID=A0A5S9QRL3_9GAMM|nr:Uncharacterised protein [BD1-7 clade bacterium]CAA0121332.1 Uncharacterised protein [BD1-7 clade bacterium]